MTPNEALKIIDKVHDYPCPYGIGGNAWRFIRICIEKQVPKKPDYEDYDAKCPVCGHEFENNVNDWGCSYCQGCGQKLDWSDEE